MADDKLKDVETAVWWLGDNAGQITDHESKGQLVVPVSVSGKDAITTKAGWAVGK